MLNSHQENVELFASNFVRNYWETVKHGDFQMPPDEAVEETVEELLSDISYTTDIQDASCNPGLLFHLQMTSKHGDWWCFTFRCAAKDWNLVECSARSGIDAEPHDLLGPVYSQYFEPFLMHVTDVSNSQNRK